MKVVQNRHTTAQLASITPEEGLILMDVTKGTLVVGDGSTKGGNPLTQIDGITSTAAEINLVDGFVAPAVLGESIKKVVSVPFLYSDQSASGAWDSTVTIPDNAVITRCWYDVIATFGGDGDDSSTIAIHVEGADDMVAAVAIQTGTPFDAGFQEGIPQTSDVSTYVKTTQARNVTVTVAINATDTALDQGSMMIFLEYIQSI